MRARIYARFSTDKQREASIEDQLSADRALAERLGAFVTGVYADRAISGQRQDRPEFLRMLADARAGEFDLLVLWDLKRLSRGEDMPQLLAQLQFMGVRIVTCDGFDSQQEGSDLRGWVEGMMANRYVKDLAKNVHRGLSGQFDRDFFTGGLPYGYSSRIVGPVEKPDGHRLEIDEEQAKWVRLIFERYAEGWSPQRIAAELNRRRVPSPRGSTWAVSAIYGNRRKTCGVLNNPLYAGVYIWNRSRWVKDPTNRNKRKRIERPESEWRRAEKPELRIVPEALWDAVKRRQGPEAKNTGGRPARTLLSGLLRCGCCGGAVVAVSQYAYGCAARKDRGPAVCEGVRVPRADLEETLIGLVRDDLLSEASLAQLSAMVRETLKARQKAAAGPDPRAALTKVEREIANLVDAIAVAGMSQALRSRLSAAEVERDRLKAELKPATPIPDFIPNLRGRFEKLLANLPETLARRPAAAREALAAILGEVILQPEDGAVWAEMSGCFSGVFARFDLGKRSPATIVRITRRLKVA